MKLGELLRADVVQLDLEASNKWEAIEKMVNLLVEKSLIRHPDREKILESIVAREKSMSTGIGKGVGIPHATTELLPEVVGAYARLKNPIEFDAIDGEPVQHLVLMVIPKSQYQQHIKTLAGIARLMNDEKARKALTAAATPEETLTVVQKSEAL